MPAVLDLVLVRGRRRSSPTGAHGPRLEVDLSRSALAHPATSPPGPVTGGDRSRFAKSVKSLSTTRHSPTKFFLMIVLPTGARSRRRRGCRHQPEGAKLPLSERCRLPPAEVDLSAQWSATWRGRRGGPPWLSTKARRTTTVTARVTAESTGPPVYRPSAPVRSRTCSWVCSSSGRSASATSASPSLLAWAKRSR